MASLWKRGQGNRLKASNNEVTVSFFLLMIWYFVITFLAKMVQTCVAFGCVNVSKKNSGITFYKFPPIKRAAIREKWIHAMRRIGFQPGNFAKVCTSYVISKKIYALWIMTCSFLFLTGKMSISSVFVTMLAFNLAVFPCPLFHKLKAQGAEKTADFLQFRHEALSSVGCPIPLSLIHGRGRGTLIKQKQLLI